MNEVGCFRQPKYFCDERLRMVFVIDFTIRRVTLLGQRTAELTAHAVTVPAVSLAVQGPLLRVSTWVWAEKHAGPWEQMHRH